MHERRHPARPIGTAWYSSTTRLLLQQPTAVVALNRAVAVSMAYGPTEALADVDAIVASGDLAKYHLLFAVRADLLQRLGRIDEARREFYGAAELTKSPGERALLLERAMKLEDLADS